MAIKTPKGTELPLLNLKGKDYLQVPHRVLWFREERPNWRIVTEYVCITETSAFAKATILDESGAIVATSHKYEDKQGFGDFREKAETGAIGRALALCGFGTAFAMELEESHERIVDSPQQRVQKHNLPSSLTAGERPENPSGPPPTPHQFPNGTAQLEQLRAQLRQIITDQGYTDKGEICGILQRLVKRNSTKELDEREISTVREWFFKNAKPIE